MPAKQTFADTYLAKLGADKRATLEKVRAAIRAAAPDAEEGVSYGLPAFIQGKAIAGYAAGKDHCAYYPMSGSVVKDLKGKLKNYQTSKGAIRFPIGKPLPTPLIRKLVTARLGEIAAKGSNSGAAATSKTRSASHAEAKRALGALEKMASKAHREGLERYGIVTQDRTLGVPMGMIQKLAKQIGRDHELATALWESGVYEGRMLAIFVAEPERVTPAEMEAWVRDFDNWAVCDTVCFKLWDRTSHAWAKVAKWVKRREEFVKRAGFALIASLALHDKKAPEEPFVRALAFIEGAADDRRNFVKKGVSWALRGIGARNVALKAKARAVAERLAASDEPSARWIGKDALREFARKG